MDNDDLIIGRILSRREALALAGAAGFSLLSRGGGGTEGLAVSSRAIDLVATPQVTEGPFFVDEKLNRSNLLEGTTRPSVVNGLPLKLRLAIYELNVPKGIPLSGAHVDIWHTDAIGVYSDEASGSIQNENTKGQTWLRGYQVSDANG